MAQWSPAPLVGRDTELDHVGVILDRLRGGQGGLVELLGDPGIGKTRLLGAVTDAARRRGLLVLSGCALESEKGIPYALFGEVFYSRLSADDESGSPDELSWLTRASVNGDPAPPNDRERYVRHRGLRDLLARWAETTPIVLALDDVHWCDAASADLLAYLLQRPIPRPVLVVIAYRPYQLRGRLAAVLHQAVGLGQVDRIELGPLSRANAARLLGPETAADTAGRLYELSGGNPFYLLALRDAGAARGVEAAVLSELESCADDAFLVARAAAVAGEPVEPELVAAIAQVPYEAALTAMEELRACDVLRGGTGDLRFRHPLVRQIFYEGSDAAWRFTAHGRASLALERRGVPATVRAYHVERGARPGDSTAIALLVEAAAEARRRNPGAAAVWYEAALRITPGGDDHVHQRRELLFHLGSALGVSGRLTEARAVFGRLLDELSAGEETVRAGVVALCASIERLLGRHRESRALLREQLDALTDPDGPAAAALLSELACHHFLRRETDEHLRYARLTYANAAGRGDAAATASAAMLIGHAHGTAGALPQAARRLREAGEMFDDLTDDEILGKLESFVGLGWAEAELDRYHDAIRHLRRAIRLARATGQDYTLSPLSTVLAEALLCSGRLTEASAAARDALDTAIHTGTDVQRMLALAKQGEIAFWAGDLAAAGRHTEEAAEVAAVFTDHFSALVRANLALMRVVGGDGRGRVADYVDGHGGPGLPLLNPALRARAYRMLVQAELAGGRDGEAAAWAGRARRVAERVELPAASGHALIASASAVLRDDPSGALEYARSAVRAFREAGAVLHMAAANVVVFQAHEALGSPAQAVDGLRDAESIFRTSGAPLLAGQARDRYEAWRAGRAPGRRASEATTDRLSPRERQVAELICEGLSNRQIGRALNVADKTVEVHVSRILKKFDVPSRAAVAAIITRSIGNGKAE